MWVLGTRPGSSGRAASVLQRWAVSSRSFDYTFTNDFFHTVSLDVSRSSCLELICGGDGTVLWRCHGEKPCTVIKSQKEVSPVWLCVPNCGAPPSPHLKPINTTRLSWGDQVTYCGKGLCELWSTFQNPFSLISILEYLLSDFPGVLELATK